MAVFVFEKEVNHERCERHEKTRKKNDWVFAQTLLDFERSGSGKRWEAFRSPQFDAPPSTPLFLLLSCFFAPFVVPKNLTATALPLQVDRQLVDLRR
ncbi:MAG: hypothetical protein AAGB00_05920, partial [Planctomycetota bacterium]